jgi:hypothetical protein
LLHPEELAIARGMLTVICLSLVVAQTPETPAAPLPSSPALAEGETSTDTSALDQEAVDAIRDFAEEVYRNRLEHQMKHADKRHEHQHDHSQKKYYGVDEPADARPRSARQARTETLAVTVSPVLIERGTVLRLGAEMMLNPRMSAAFYLGTGSYEARSKAFIALNALEVAGQFRFYPLGDFRSGVHVGAELQYLHINDGEPPGSYVEDRPAIGPLAGAKYTTPSGLTAEAQVGALFPSTREEDEERTVAPLLNLNFGWSFSL